MKADDQHEQEMQDQQSKYEHKLAREMERYFEATAEIEKLKSQHREGISMREQAHEKVIQDLIRSHSK